MRLGDLTRPLCPVLSQAGGKKDKCPVEEEREGGERR